MLHEGRLGQGLRHEVGRVGLTSDLEELQVAGADPLLDPKESDGEVPDASYAAAFGNADGSGAVRPQLKAHGFAQVEVESLKSKPLRRPPSRSRRARPRRC